VALGAARHDLGDGAVGDQPSASDDDQVVGGQRHLTHQVARDEYSPALLGQAAQDRTDPVDAFGIQAVHRFVAQDHRRVTEQRGGQTQPLAHAEREAAGAPRSDVVQADQVEHRVDARTGDAVALGQAQ